MIGERVTVMHSKWVLVFLPKIHFHGNRLCVAMCCFPLLPVRQRCASSFGGGISSANVMLGIVRVLHCWHLKQAKSYINMYHIWIIYGHAWICDRLYAAINQTIMMILIYGDFLIWCCSSSKARHLSLYITFFPHSPSVVLNCSHSLAC